MTNYAQRFIHMASLLLKYIDVLVTQETMQTFIITVFCLFLATACYAHFECPFVDKRQCTSDAYAKYYESLDLFAMHKENGELAALIHRNTSLNAPQTSQSAVFFLVNRTSAVERVRKLCKGFDTITVDKIGPYKVDFTVIASWYFGLVTFSEAVHALAHSPASRIDLKTQYLTNIFGDTFNANVDAVTTELYEQDLLIIHEQLREMEGTLPYYISSIYLHHAIKVHSRKSPTIPPAFTNFIIESLMTLEMSALAWYSKSPATLQSIYSNLPIRMKRVFYAGTETHALLVQVERLGESDDYTKDFYRLTYVNSGYNGGYHPGKTEYIEKLGQEILQLVPYVVFDRVSWKRIADDGFHKGTIQQVYHNGEGMSKRDADSKKDYVNAQQSGTCTAFSIKFWMRHLVHGNRMLAFEHEIELAILETAVAELISMQAQLKKTTGELNDIFDARVQAELEAAKEVLQAGGATEEELKNVKPPPIDYTEITGKNGELWKTRLILERDIQLNKVMLSVGFNDRLTSVITAFSQGQTEAASKLFSAFQRVWEGLLSKHGDDFVWMEVASNVSSLYDYACSLFGTKKSPRLSVKVEKMSPQQKKAIACFEGLGGEKNRNAVIGCILTAATTAGDTAEYISRLDAFLKQKDTALDTSKQKNTTALNTNERYLLILYAAMTQKNKLIEHLMWKYDDFRLVFLGIPMNDNEYVGLEELESAKPNEDVVKRLAAYNMAMYGQPTHAAPSILHIVHRVGDKKTVKYEPIHERFFSLLVEDKNYFAATLTFLEILEAVCVIDGLPAVNAYKMPRKMTTSLFWLVDETGDYLSSHEKVLIEELLYRSCSSTGYWIYKFLERLKVPTYLANNTSKLACDTNLARKLYRCVTSEEQAVKAATNLIVCHDQSLARLTQSTDLVNAFSQELRPSTTFKIDNDSARADAIAKFISKCRDQKSLFNFSECTKIKQTYEEAYEWVVERAVVPTDITQDYFNTLFTTFPPFPERDFQHYFANILFRNLDKLEGKLGTKESCEFLLKSAAQRATSRTVVVEKRLHFAKVTVLPAPITPETILFVANKYFCGSIRDDESRTTAITGSQKPGKETLHEKEAVEQVAQQDVVEKEERVLEILEEEEWVQEVVVEEGRVPEVIYEEEEWEPRAIYEEEEWEPRVVYEEESMPTTEVESVALVAPVTLSSSELSKEKAEVKDRADYFLVVLKQAALSSSERFCPVFDRLIRHYDLTSPYIRYLLMSAVFEGEFVNENVALELIKLDIPLLTQLQPSEMTSKVRIEEIVAFDQLESYSNAHYRKLGFRWPKFLAFLKEQTDKDDTFFSKHFAKFYEADSLFQLKALLELAMSTMKESDYLHFLDNYCNGGDCTHMFDRNANYLLYHILSRRKFTKAAVAWTRRSWIKLDAPLECSKYSDDSEFVEAFVNEPIDYEDFTNFADSDELEKTACNVFLFGRTSLIGKEASLV